MTETIWFPIVLFVIASVVTVFISIKLAHYGDAIAETTGLGRGLVGLILLSAATSLPELFSSSSASFIGNVDLAFGNIFGSNMTNIFILFIMDFFVRGRPILLGVSQKNVMTGGIVIFVTCIALLMMIIPKLFDLELFNVSKVVVSKHDFWYFPPILFLLYIVGMLIIYKNEKVNMDESSSEKKDSPNMTRQKAIKGFLISAILLFGAAILLSYSCDKISKIPINGQALGGTFVGTIFLAFTTSLPEIVVSIAALRIGSYDMALGNLFGSNLFNLAILSFSDGFYRLGGLIRDVPISKDAFTLSHPNHLISGMIGLIFVGIVLSSLMLRRKTKRGPLGFDTLTIGILYVLGLYLLFILR